MEQVDQEFNVPYYIFEEIIKYVELTEKVYCKCMKWENIKTLLQLAVINNRLTKEQAEFLEKEFYRERSITRMLQKYKIFATKYISQ